MKKLYMHTIMDKPAQYWEGEQICFASRVKKFAKSLYQIRKEQKLSEKWRKKNKFSSGFEYGYVIIYV